MQCEVIKKQRVPRQAHPKELGKVPQTKQKKSYQFRRRVDRIVLHVDSSRVGREVGYPYGTYPRGCFLGFRGHASAKRQSSRFTTRRRNTYRTAALLLRIMFPRDGTVSHNRQPIYSSEQQAN